MSKASEYAKHKQEAPTFMADSKLEVASVSDIGDCILKWVIIKPNSALKLADWIYEIFGENEEEK